MVKGLPDTELLGGLRGSKKDVSSFRRTKQRGKYGESETRSRHPKSEAHYRKTKTGLKRKFEVHGGEARGERSTPLGSKKKSPDKAGRHHLPRRKEKRFQLNAGESGFTHERRGKEKSKAAGSKVRE